MDKENCWFLLNTKIGLDLTRASFIDLRDFPFLVTTCFNFRVLATSKLIYCVIHEQSLSSWHALAQNKRIKMQ